MDERDPAKFWWKAKTFPEMTKEELMEALVEMCIRDRANREGFRKNLQILQDAHNAGKTKSGN